MSVLTDLTDFAGKSAKSARWVGIPNDLAGFVGKSERSARSRRKWATSVISVGIPTELADLAEMAEMGEIGEYARSVNIQNLRFR